MGKGIEAFPDLGEHCEQDDCKQLDFLPFTCSGCHKVFCLEHRTYKSHNCPKSEHESRVVVICDICSSTIDKESAYEEEKVTLEAHKKSGECDPMKKKQKKKCPVHRCKEMLTFSNTSTCKSCSVQVCLKHRFASDHDCKRGASVAALVAKRNGVDCRKEKQKLPVSSLSIKAY